MTYPDLIRAGLDQAIALARQNSTFAAKRPSRIRKVTHEDIIKALIFMEGDSLQAVTNVFAAIQDTPNVDLLIRVRQGRGAMCPIAELLMEGSYKMVPFVLITTQISEDKRKRRMLIQTHRDDKRQYSDKTRGMRWDFPSPYPMALRVVRVLLDTGPSRPRYCPALRWRRS